MNPFLTNITGFYGRRVEEPGAEGRARMARGFTRAECEAALQRADLQVTVRKVVERRLRQLKHEVSR